MVDGSGRPPYILDVYHLASSESLTGLGAPLLRWQERALGGSGREEDFISLETPGERPERNRIAQRAHRRNTVLPVPPHVPAEAVGRARLQSHID